MPPESRTVDAEAEVEKLASSGDGLLAAHARLAALDSAESENLCLPELLSTLLLAAGRDRGVLVDPAAPASLRASGPVPSESAIGEAIERHGRPDAPETLAEIFGAGSDARAIPLTAGEETLALLLLPAPPVEPVGFASVIAHAAALLARIRMGFELKMRLWELESLYDLGLSIARTLDLESLVDDVLLKSVSLLNARMGTLVLNHPSGDGLLSRDVGGSLVTREFTSEIPYEEEFVANDRASRPAAFANAPAEKLLGVPITCDGKRLGILIVADKENRSGGVDDWTESDKRVLKLFGNQAAIALENARLHREAVEKERMEREIELAASIQKTILPTALPLGVGLELAGGNRPTRQVGGDYFNVFPLPDGRTVLCVADVSGKGVPAALLVSTVHACLQLLIPVHASDLPTLALQINRHLVGFSSTRKFVTLFIAVHDPVRRELRYLNAGHNPGLWLSDDRLERLPSGGVPIGMLPNALHKEAAISVTPGDIVLLYSDGITEAINADDEEFGMERLEALVRSGCKSPMLEMSDCVLDAVSAFTRGVAQYDDQTVLVARIVEATA